MVKPNRELGMSERIEYKLTFFFNSKNRLITIVEAEWNKEAINLSKSSFMLFLYQNEDKLGRAGVAK